MFGGGGGVAGVALESMTVKGTVQVYSYSGTQPSTTLLVKQ